MKAIEAAAEWSPISTNPSYLSDETCFKTTHSELVSSGYELVLGFQFEEPVFMHAITIAED